MASHDVRWWFVENQARFVEVKDLSQKGPVGGLFTPVAVVGLFYSTYFGVISTVIHLLSAIYRNPCININMEPQRPSPIFSKEHDPNQTSMKNMFQRFIFRGVVSSASR